MIAENLIFDLTLSISGMSCNSCALSVEKAVSTKSGVSSAIVNLATNSARIVFSSLEITAEDIRSCIEDIGFDAEIVTCEVSCSDFSRSISFERTFIINIEHDFHSKESMDSILQELVVRSERIDGLTNVNLSKSKRIITVKLDDTKTGPRDILSVCKLLQISVNIYPMGGTIVTDRQVDKRRLEQRHHLLVLIICIIFVLPIIAIDMILPLYPSYHSTFTAPIWPGLDLSSLILFGCATVIQFGIGMKFYMKAYLSIKSGNAIGMDFLVSSGTSAAYLFALVGFIRGAVTGVSHDEDVSYAETSAVLITVIVLGKYLETSARNATSAALSGLNEKRARKARLVRAAGSALRGKGEGLVDGVVAVDVQDELIDIDMLHYGDVVRLVEGEPVPADGKLLNATSAFAVDESLLTGETFPVDKAVGGDVIGGSVVIQGTGLLEVTACGDRSVLGKIVTAMQDAQLSKPRIQEIADRVAKYFVPAVTIMSCTTFTIWFLLGLSGMVPDHLLDAYEQNPFYLAFSFGLAVWVSACPCAIGLATPTAIMVSTGVAAKNGILIRRGAAIQNAAGITALALDKTGTLTLGKPAVSDFFLYPNNTNNNDKSSNSPQSNDLLPNSNSASTQRVQPVGNQRVLEITKRCVDNIQASQVPNYVTILRLLLQAERRSSHPIASGIVAYCNEHLLRLQAKYGGEISAYNDSRLSVNLSEEPEFEALPGQGIRLVYKNGMEVVIGSIDLMISSSFPVSQYDKSLVEGLRAGGKVVVVLAIDGILRAIIGLSDLPRAETREVIRRLKKKKIECYMITGDHVVTANAIASAIGIPSYRVMAGTKPQDKRIFVERLQANGHCVGFVGDGTNDSLALTQAEIGFAMGAGTEIAVGAGDMVLCRNDLKSVLTALELCRSTMRRIQLNFFWAMVYNGLLMPVAAGVLVPHFGIVLSPMLAGAAMALSSVSIVLSSLSLLAFKSSASNIVTEYNFENTKDGYDAVDDDEDCPCPASVLDLAGPIQSNIFKHIYKLFYRKEAPTPIATHDKCACGSVNCNCSVECTCKPVDSMNLI